MCQYNSNPTSSPGNGASLRIVSALPYVGQQATRPLNLWSCPLRWYGTEPPPDGLALGTLRRIVGLMRPYWRRVTVAFLLGVTMLAITLFIPLITRTIIDDGLTRRVPGVLARETALLLGLAVVRWGVGGLRRN